MHAFALGKNKIAPKCCEFKVETSLCVLKIRSWLTCNFLDKSLSDLNSYCKKIKARNPANECRLYVKMLWNYQGKIHLYLLECISLLCSEVSECRLNQSLGALFMYIMALDFLRLASVHWSFSLPLLISLSRWEACALALPSLKCTARRFTFALLICIFHSLFHPLFLSAEIL